VDRYFRPGKKRQRDCTEQTSRRAPGLRYEAFIARSELEDGLGADMVMKKT